MKKLSVPTPGKHDPDLPDWGPYSKKYFGLSHVADVDRALRFDTFVMPQLLRRKRELPDALVPCGLIPEHAMPDLSAWQCSWRLDENVTAFVKFQQIPGENGAGIECVFENRADHPVDAALHWFAQLVFENPVSTQAVGTLALLTPELPAGRGVEYDSRLPREKMDSSAVNGSVFEFHAGETVEFVIPEKFTGCRYFIRFRQTDGDWEIREITGNSFVAPAETDVDVLAVTATEVPEFVTVENNVMPEITYADRRRLDFTYPGSGKNLCYSCCADGEMTFYRRYAVDDLRSFFRYRDIVQQPYDLEILNFGSMADQALNWVVQPLHILPHSTLTRSFTIRCGSGENGFVPLPEVEFPEFAAPCRRSCERLAAVTLTNVIFPARICGQNVRHFTPGRQWNSLYTWDSGFIGLGMLEISPQTAAEILNAYLTLPGDRHNAFVLHGTPLPVQIFLLYELWNRTCDRELLRTLYPGARQFYRYLSGNHPGSTTRKYCREPLISTWDYFYNSGGWDDYPAQMEVHRKQLTGRVLPVVQSAVLIRCARILQNLASVAGIQPDLQYEQDIAGISDALLKYSWDEESGYFGYICCDADGNPQGILRTDTGENFNRGLDGTSPLLSGFLPENISGRLWAHIESERECFTPSGISTVDRSASYFRENGYWNGAVWMPHQWFLWKAALDAGKGDFAWKIAETALRTYDRECESSGYCFEHFSTRSGWGGGWHHFSGLSTPVLCWHEAYFGKSRFTCGFDTVVCQRQDFADRVEIEFVQHGIPGRRSTVLFSTPVKRVTCNGVDLPFVTRGGAVEITIANGTSGKLQIFPA